MLQLFFWIFKNEIRSKVYHSNELFDNICYVSYTCVQLGSIMFLSSLDEPLCGVMMTFE